MKRSIWIFLLAIVLPSIGLGWLARFQGDSDRAESAFGAGLRVASEVGAEMTTAGALTGHEA